MATRIMIDAGHFAKSNRSPVVPEYYESEMNWTLQNFLKAALEAYGFEVGLTRDSQEIDLEVTARGRKAKGYDFFISLHSNACGDESVNRVVSINMVDNPDEYLTDVSNNLSQKLAVAVAELMQVSGGAQWYELLADTDRNRDGLKNDNYYGVLYGCQVVNVPGIILEHSFHTNTDATNWLLDENNLYKMALLEADILADYFGLSKVPGDVSGDGICDAKDYLMAKRAALGTFVLTDVQAKAADVDHDGDVDAKDYLMLKRHVLGTFDLK